MKKKKINPNPPDLVIDEDEDIYIPDSFLKELEYIKCALVDIIKHPKEREIKFIRLHRQIGICIFWMKNVIKRETKKTLFKASLVINKIKIH